MAKYSGKDVVVKFGTFNAGGYGRSLEVSQSADEIDVTTYGSSDKEYIAGFVDRSATLEILDGTDNPDTVKNAFAPGSSSSLTWYPQGTASGKPMYSVGTAVVTEANESYPYDDAVTISVTMRLSGAVTAGTAT